MACTTLIRTVIVCPSSTADTSNSADAKAKTSFVADIVAMNFNAPILTADA